MIGLIETLSTLLLLNLEDELNKDDIDYNTQHPPCILQLGIGMDPPPFKLLLGGDVGIDVGIKDTPGHLHFFAFLSGTRKEEVKNNNIEENNFLIPFTVDE